MSEVKQPKPGERVIFHEPDGAAHEALCTTDWGACINVVYVSGDAKRTDPYGRQLERATSVSHASVNKVHGYNWHWPEEEPNPYVPPVSV